MRGDSIQQPAGLLPAYRAFIVPITRFTMDTYVSREFKYSMLSAWSARVVFVNWTDKVREIMIQWKSKDLTK